MIRDMLRTLTLQNHEVEAAPCTHERVTFMPMSEAVHSVRNKNRLMVRVRVACKDCEQVWTNDLHFETQLVEEINTAKFQAETWQRRWGMIAAKLAVITKAIRSYETEDMPIVSEQE